MKRPNFQEGLHPQLDCDLVNKRKIEYMTKLEERLNIDCPGCPGCPDDCPDALDVCADTIAALAKENTRLEGVAKAERCSELRDFLSAKIAKPMWRPGMPGRDCHEVAIELLQHMGHALELIDIYQVRGELDAGSIAWNIHKALRPHGKALGE